MHSCPVDGKPKRRRHQLAAALLLFAVSGNLVSASSAAQTAADLPLPKHARPTLSVHTIENFYDVNRWSQRNLLVPAAAHPAAGLTQTNLTLRKQLLSQAGSCRAIELSIVIEVTITMPRWSGPAARKPVDMDPALAHLRAHENVHRDHALAAAEKLQQALSRLPNGENCRQMEHLISQHLRRQMFHLDMRGEVFDQLTDFGRRGLPEAARRRVQPSSGVPL
jgi:predicted secreted Zn-dependent protease